MSSSGLVEERLQEQRAARAKYSDLVKRLGQKRLADPSKYRARVVGFAVLGYAYVLAVLALGLSFLGGAIWLFVTNHSGSGVFKLGFFGLFLAWIVLRALWIRIEETEPGVVVSRERCPVLHREIEEICRKLQAPKVHSVKIGWDSNAWAAELPKLGLLGVYHRRLYLGMPLLFALTPDQLRSVIAHELGHFSERHGRFGLWLYRLERTWMSLSQSIQQTQSWAAAFLFRKFLSWYVPLMEAHGGVMSRAGELDADGYAREVAGEEASWALLRLAWINNHVDESIQKRMDRLAQEGAELPADFIGIIEDAMSRPPAVDRAARDIRVALAEATEDDGTHPSLADRLDAAGFEVELDDPAWLQKASSLPEVTAATAFLGNALPSLKADLDGVWRDLAKDNWAAHHEELVQARTRLAELDAKSDLTPEELVEKADLVDTLEGSAKAIELKKANLAAHPNEPAVVFDYGASLLVDQNDSAGLGYVERAMELDPGYQEAGLTIMASHYGRNARTEELKELRARYEELSVHHEVVEEELNEMTPGQTYVEHGLPGKVVAEVAEKSASIEGLAALYVARLTITRVETRPHLVVVGIMDPHWRRLKLDDERETKLRDALIENLDFEERAMFYVPAKAKPWVRALDKVNGALLFRAAK